MGKGPGGTTKPLLLQVYILAGAVSNNEVEIYSMTSGRNKRYAENESRVSEIESWNDIRYNIMEWVHLSYLTRPK